MTYDVAIIGAGPSGSCAASFLAKAGLKVVVLEKDVFPRFHIGESLLPLGVTVLERLGIKLDHTSFAVRKAGAQVIHEPTSQWYHINFAMTLEGCFTHAYQVERASFDHHLANTAASFGAELRFNTQVIDAQEEGNAVVLNLADGSLRARYLIDASGINCFSARRGKHVQRIKGMGKCATFSQFAQVNSMRAKQVFQNGDILLLLLDHGWGWAIPLSGDRLSVGTVHADGTKVPSPRDAFEAFMTESPLLNEVLTGAHQVEPIRRCSDFSYYNQVPTTNRQAVVGDARVFLDPVFSSGVSFGLFTSWKMAEALTPLVQQDASLEHGLEAYRTEMEQGYSVIERVIERFYRPGWAHNTFFASDKADTMVYQLNTMLAGDVWRKDNDWQTKILASRRRTIRFESSAIAEAN